MGKRYQGTYTPVVSKELWQKVQDMLDGKSQKRQRRAKHDFAFSRLITCGHCGCSLVGELKKGKYVYYHCTGYKGKCPEPYVWEEVLEEKFTEVLKGLAFDEEVVGWISQALRESHVDEKQFHDEAITRLRRDYDRLQNRISQMYVEQSGGRSRNGFRRASRGRPVLPRRRYRTSRTCAHSACSVREAATERKTTAPRFRTIELDVEGRRAVGHVSPTL